MRCNFSKIVLFIVFLLFFNLFSSDCDNSIKPETCVGQHFIMALPKYNEISKYSNWLKQVKPAGVMLLEYHMQDRTKTNQICHALQDMARELSIYPLLICVDFEGGIVSRGADVHGFVSAPSPYKLALKGKADCFLAGKLIGHQLHDAKVWVNFAPSVDLFDSENYILATRCMSHDPQTVANCSQSFINGSLSEGVLPTIKHFPGLGRSKLDTHTNDVEIKMSNEEFEANITPFRTLLIQVPDLAIMVGHGIYEQFGNIPASSNAKVVSWIKQYNPNALIITDDASMQSYHRSSNSSQKLNCICKVAKKSIQNGFDLIIFSAPPEEQINLIKTLNCMNFDDKSDTRAKIEKLYKKLDTIIPSNINEIDTSMELAKKIVDGTTEEISNTNKIFMISTDLNKIRPETRFAEILNANKETKRQTQLATLFTESKYDVTEVILNPMSDESVQELKNLMYTSTFQNSDKIIIQTFFYGDGNWNKIQKKWIKLLKSYTKKLLLISLGHPYEHQLISTAQILELGSFHPPLIKAAFDILKKKH